MFTQLLLIVAVLLALMHWDKVARLFRSLRRQDAASIRRAGDIPFPARPVESRADREARARHEEAMQEIQALSPDTARQRAEAALADTRRWRVVAAEAGSFPFEAELAESVRALFARRASIEEAFGGARLDRESIAPFIRPRKDTLSFGTSSQAEPERHLQIGVDTEGNPLIVRPREDTLYIVHHFSASGEGFWLSDHPSVYHWILVRHYFLLEG